MSINKFNVRVYGLLVNEQNQLLVSDEAFVNGNKATKFPGGGLEIGEGPAEGLLREFIEETGVPVQIVAHFYTTHFYVPNMFEIIPTSQVISIYYVVQCPQWQQIPASNIPFNFTHIPGQEAEAFRWVPLDTLAHETTITLPIDKVVVNLLLQQYQMHGPHFYKHLPPMSNGN